MLSYCLKCKKSTESTNPEVSKCAICSSKKSKFFKEQQAKGLLSNLGITTPINTTPLLGNILF